VVVDDAIAFVGGIDLTSCRWDTPEHRVDVAVDTARLARGARQALRP
jgi:hypothetical protein